MRPLLLFLIILMEFKVSIATGTFSSIPDPRNINQLVNNYIVPKMAIVQSTPTRLHPSATISKSFTSFSSLSSVLPVLSSSSHSTSVSLEMTTLPGNPSYLQPSPSVMDSSHLSSHSKSASISGSVSLAFSNNVSPLQSSSLLPIPPSSVSSSLFLSTSFSDSHQMLKATPLLSSSALSKSSLYKIQSRLSALRPTSTTAQNPFLSTVSSISKSITSQSAAVLVPLTPPKPQLHHTPTLRNSANSTILPPSTTAGQPSCDTKQPVTNNHPCSITLNQFPPCISFHETETPGFILAAVNKTSNLSISVSIIGPRDVVSVLQGYINITETLDELHLTLTEQLDIEEIYESTGKTVAVKDFTLEIMCNTPSDKNANVTSEFTRINVTVLDVDDKSPYFEQDVSTSDCAVPVYKADADENFMGPLTFTPGQIRAVDGDLFSRHSISYEVKHGEPYNYDEYFELDPLEGSVNKTRAMNSTDPSRFVLFLQATEESFQKRSVMGLVVITVVSQTTDTKNTTVNPWIRSALWIISALILLAFVTGVLIIVLHRRKCHVATETPNTDSKQENLVPMMVLDVSSEDLTEKAEKVHQVESEPSMVTSISSISQIRVAEWKGNKSSSLGVLHRQTWNAAYKTKPVKTTVQHGSRVAKKKK